ncbi:MAG: hypothetical protein AB4911_18565, partial [Oscillochloridaceae bacterium umkhey_bin13]
MLADLPQCVNLAKRMHDIGHVPGFGMVWRLRRQTIPKPCGAAYLHHTHRNSGGVGKSGVLSVYLGGGRL